MAVDIRPVPFPDRLGSPESVEFERYAEFAIAIEIERWGDDRLADTPAEMLAMYRDETYEMRRAFAAWDGDACVGRTISWWERDPAAKTGAVIVEVAAAYRRQGLGNRLLEHAEGVITDLGRSIYLGWVDYPLAQLDAAGSAALRPRRRRHDPGRPAERPVRHASRLRHRTARTLECARGRRPHRRVPRRVGAARGRGIRLSPRRLDRPRPRRAHRQLRRGARPDGARRARRRPDDRRGAVGRRPRARARIAGDRRRTHPARAGRRHAPTARSPDTPNSSCRPGSGSPTSPTPSSSPPIAATGSACA